VIEEPEFDPDLEDVKPWWERFYLRSNPFPRKDGLSAIDQELYESVVVKTEPFVRIQSSLRRDPDCLFNTAFLLVGDFGFGKTTLLDYLAYHVVQYDVVTIRITCGKAHTTANGFLDSFYSKLRTALAREVNVIANRPLAGAQLDVEDEILFLATLINDRKRGVLILLDDYHKHLTATAPVFEFLGQLQILKDQLTRDELKIGFIVSGLPEWEKHLPQYTQLSGFLDSPVMRMPQITPMAIAEVFNQRIAAYGVDSQARTIRKEFVERIFHQTGATSGYREYLNRIISELEQDNFAIIDTPIEIPASELNSIRIILEKDLEIAAALSKLRFESSFKRFTGRQVLKCLELLVQVGLRGGVPEADELFIQNAFYFQRLKDVSLIQKQKSTDNKNAFVWTLRKRLKNAVNEIQLKFRRSLSDYFLKIYGGSVERREVLISEPGLDASRKLEEMLKRDLSRVVRETLQQAKGLLDSLDIEQPSSQQRRELVERTSLVLNCLIKAIFQLDASLTFFEEAGISETQHRLAVHWMADETVIEALRRFSSCSADSDRTQLEMALKQGKEACESLITTLDEISRDITDSTRLFAFRHRATSHNSDALDLFSEVQRNYYSADPEKHFQYVDKITNYLEQCLRSFLYTTTTLGFGANDYFNAVPAQEKKYAIQNSKSRRQFSNIANHFEGFTRSQFRTVFNSSGNIKAVVTDAIELGWSSDDRDLFFNLFAEESIATSHKQLSAYSPVDRSRYIQYCRLAEFVTFKLNNFLTKVVTKQAVVFVADVTAPEMDIASCIFRFGMKADKRKSMPESHLMLLGHEMPFLHGTHLIEHTANENDLKKVRSTLDAAFNLSAYLTDDLLDLEYLRSHYDVPFVEYVCCLSYLAWVSKEIRLLPWFGSSIMIVRNGFQGR